MTNYLTNELYLYLVLYSDTISKINFSDIAKKTGKTRQSISKYYKILLEENMITQEDNNIIVDNRYELNKAEINFIRETFNIYPATYIAYIIYKERYPFETDESISRRLGVSRKKIDLYLADMKQNGKMKNYIYAIIQNQKIMYIGSTCCLNMRMEQHCRKRQFLKEKDFIILEECNKNNRFEREAYYRRKYLPELNQII
jgi:DNA-binding transcriptional ArsR family regulator